MYLELGSDLIPPLATLLFVAFASLCVARLPVDELAPIAQPRTSTSPPLAA